MRLLPVLLLSLLACDQPTNATPAPPSAAPAGTTCTPHFTPYQPGADGCSANHTVCTTADDGTPICHGGAIQIPCGESGERCGETFRCECPDAGAN